MPDLFDVVLLARIQFAFTIAFHILFPAFTIGAASYLVVLEALWLKTADRRYRRLFDFWLKLFALSFGMGVVSGLVMSYQFGTNWSEFSVATGNILGPLMAYEVFSAFFLEATFLGIMLFGRERVGRGLYLFATVMVALGTLISSFWILAANSWMHTPAGYALNEGVFSAVDWWAIVFNPSMPYRFVHMVLAAYLATSVTVAAVGAYHLLRDHQDHDARLMLRMALPFMLAVGVAQLVAGHLQGVNVHQYQPAKLAAIEGHWSTYERDAPLILFAWPDAVAEKNRWQLAIPDIGSVAVTGSRDGRIEGLQEWPVEERPPVAIVFWSFRLMVALGIVIVGIGLLGSWRLLRGRLAEARWLLRITAFMAPVGYIALLAGWVTAEVGRQPFVVYGLMRTRDAVSPISADAVGLSLMIYVVGYLVVFGAGIGYMLREARRGPRGGKA